MKERIQGVEPKEYKGVKYKSTLEADTAEALDLLGLPIRYEERTFRILEGFRCPYQKDKVRDVCYTPDFWVGNMMIECKGFETPEWKLKRKLVFRFLMEHEPYLLFYQVNKKAWRKELLNALDNHWSRLGFAVQVTSKGSKRNPPVARMYESIKEAMNDLRLSGKPIARILRALTGKSQYVYNYAWKLVKIRL